MEAVYYQDGKTGACPVKEFLVPYRDKKWEKKMAFIVYIIKSICDRRNGPPFGKETEPARGFKLFKIKLIKDSKTLIRLLYFCHNDILVLLNGFEKPKNYNTEKERKKEKRHYEKADQFRKNFINNQKLYEKC